MWGNSGRHLYRHQRGLGWNPFTLLKLVPTHISDGAEAPTTRFLHRTGLHLATTRVARHSWFDIKVLSQCQTWRHCYYRDRKTHSLMPCSNNAEHEGITKNNNNNNNNDKQEYCISSFWLWSTKGSYNDGILWVLQPKMIWWNNHYSKLLECPQARQYSFSKP